MYTDVLRWTIIPTSRRRSGEVEPASRYIFLFSACLPLARRQALPRLHPLKQSSLAVADRPTTHLDVGRAVAAHARLGEPGDAHLEKLGRLLGREQYDGRRGRFLRRRASGKRRLRGHFHIPDWR